MRTPLVVLGLFVLLAVPGAAFAQNPTEDAYSGLAGSQQRSGGGGGGGGGGAVEATSPGRGAPSQAPNQDTQSASQKGGSGSLPFTGFELGMAVLLGAGLLGIGLVLRRTLGSDPQAS